MNEELSLEEGAITYWGKAYKDYQIQSVHSAWKYYGVPVAEHVPVKDMTKEQRAILLEGVESEAVKLLFPDMPLPKTVTGAYLRQGNQHLFLMF